MYYANYTYKGSSFRIKVVVQFAQNPIERANGGQRSTSSPSMPGSFDNDHRVSVVGDREPWKPWANDPESYERAVLADLEQRVGGQVSAELIRELRREFRSARLNGSYPNTTIVVSYLVHSGNVEEARFPVWHEGYRAGKEMLGPESVAELIWIWLIEPG